MNISVVVPVYNEQNSIATFVKRTVVVLDKLCQEFEIIFAMDPSTDNTEQKIQQMMQQYQQIKLLKLSRRFGQAAATMAGIEHASGDYVVVIDVDLQDPPELIETMYDLCKQGTDVAYAKRKTRQGETVIKKIITHLGYKIINKISECRIPTNTGDYRMMSRRVVTHLLALKDQQGFLRGLISYIGFKQTAVLYDREPRFADQGKYNRYLGSLTIGLNGIFGFSKRPLALLYIPACILFIICFLWVVLQLVISLFNHDAPSIAMIIIWLVCFLSSIQLFGLALIGEYLGRIYLEKNNRPLYIVDSFDRNNHHDS